MIQQALLNRGGKGGGHCVNAGMGFPGELADRCPGRLGTKYASMPARSTFMPHPKLNIGDNVDAIIWYGDTEDVVVPPDLRKLHAKYRAEFERRNRLMQEAMKLVRQ